MLQSFARRPGMKVFLKFLLHFCLVAVFSKAEDDPDLLKRFLLDVGINECTHVLYKVPTSTLPSEVATKHCDLGTE